MAEIATACKKHPSTAIELKKVNEDQKKKNTVKQIVNYMMKYTVLKMISRKKKCMLKNEPSRELTFKHKN